MVIPGSSITSLIWWISIVVIGLIGIFKFLLNHKAKALFLDEKPRPSILLDDNGKRKKSITFQHTEISSQNDTIMRNVSIQLGMLKQKYQIREIDPYKHPEQIIQANFNEVSNYNADVQEYLEDMNTFYLRDETDKFYSSYLKPIRLALYAKGRKACDQLTIDITIEGDMTNLYSAESVKPMQGQKSVAPDLTTADRSSEFYGYFPTDKEPYTYNQWKLQPARAKFAIKVESLISGIYDTESIPVIYVNTQRISQYTIKYVIHGADISANGISGNLVVNVK